MTEQTGFGEAVLNIVVMGFGLGTTFPTFTIAVQNAVPQSFLGVATAATQFYRSLGGALGLAVLGSMMASRFASDLSASLSPADRQAIPPDVLSDLSDNPQALVNPNALESIQAMLGEQGPQGADLAQNLLVALRTTLASAIGDVFLLAVVTAAVAFGATMFIREVPLRGRKPQGADARPSP